MDAGDIYAIMIATVVALLVVGIEIAVSRAWDRRMQMAMLLEELGGLLPRYTVGLSVVVGSAVDPNSDEFTRLQARVLTILTSLRVLAKWPVRRAEEIRNEAEMLNARVATAWTRFGQSPPHPLSVTEVLSGFDVRPLRHALHGEQENLQRDVDFYLANGLLGADPPWRRPRPDRIRSRFARFRSR